MNKEQQKRWTTTPRLHVEAALAANASINLSPDHSHYIMHVMRLKIGDKLRIFNAIYGEWLSEVIASGKKICTLQLSEMLRPPAPTPELWLLCAPIKKNHFDTMLEKATELGVSHIVPLITQRTQIRDVNQERCAALVREAAEQSERITVPQILPPLPLNRLKLTYGDAIFALVCAEWGTAAPISEALSQPLQPISKPTAIITGPEGGFAEEELDLLRSLPQNAFVRLGPRILRADTAAIAALTCWQAIRGDWTKITQ